MNDCFLSLKVFSQKLNIWLATSSTKRCWCGLDMQKQSINFFLAKITKKKTLAAMGLNERSVGSRFDSMAWWAVGGGKITIIWGMRARTSWFQLGTAIDRNPRVHVTIEIGRESVNRNDITTRSSRDDAEIRMHVATRLVWIGNI